jgi:hypothetical protein
MKTAEEWISEMAMRGSDLATVSAREIAAIQWDALRSVADHLDPPPAAREAVDFEKIVNRLRRDATDHTSIAYDPFLAERIMTLVSQAQNAAQEPADAREVRQ